MKLPRTRATTASAAVPPREIPQGCAAFFARDLAVAGAVAQVVPLASAATNREQCQTEASVQGTLLPGPAPVTTKRSNMSSVNGAVPTTIIIAGLALAGYALLMTARNRRMSVPLLAAVGVLEILLLVQVGIIVARLAGGERPAGLATLIGYLIAMPFIPVAAAFWGLVERSRWGPAVIAVAGLVAAVLMVRLHQIWPVIHV
jgi:hypothetical protein